ncbi:MAG: hypothetical protein ACK4SX_09645 [Alcanivoracaceae bacterium]
MTRADLFAPGDWRGGATWAASVLAFRSRSLLWPLLFHVYVGFINTGFCWIQRT